MLKKCLIINNVSSNKKVLEEKVKSIIKKHKHIEILNVIKFENSHFYLENKSYHFEIKKFDDINLLLQKSHNENNKSIYIHAISSDKSGLSNDINDSNELEYSDCILNLKLNSKTYNLGPNLDSFERKKSHKFGKSKNDHIFFQISLKKQIPEKLTFILNQNFTPCYVKFSAYDLKNDWFFEKMNKFDVISNTKIPKYNFNFSLNEIKNNLSEFYEYFTLLNLNSCEFLSLNDNYLSTYSVPFTDKENNSQKAYTRNMYKNLNSFNLIDILNEKNSWNLINCFFHKSHIILFQNTNYDFSVIWEC